MYIQRYISVKTGQFILKTNKYLESALIGEVGNNTFDHNWKFLEGKMRGAYFNLSFYNKYIVLADYGRGIKESLSSVICHKTFK